MCVCGGGGVADRSRAEKNMIYIGLSKDTSGWF